jgi:acylphosphatase
VSKRNLLIFFAVKKPTAFRLLIRGHVQGVFFRSTLRKIALQNNVTGWVKNLPDGSVEAFLQGEEKDVENVLTWCGQGPEGAFVKEIEKQPVRTDDDLRGFSILI